MLNYRDYLEILYVMVDDKDFFYCVNKSLIDDGAKVKSRGVGLNCITKKPKRCYNYQDGSYNLFYMDSLDFPNFRRLPVKVKKGMTLKDIPKATRKGVKKRFNSTIQLFSMIIIFRTTCSRFEVFNGCSEGIFSKNSNDCDPWKIFSEVEDNSSAQAKTEMNE